jgi:hypothetical protein
VFLFWISRTRQEYVRKSVCGDLWSIIYDTGDYDSDMEENKMSLKLLRQLVRLEESERLDYLLGRVYRAPCEIYNVKRR